jgi:hypothetical protein
MRVLFYLIVGVIVLTLLRSVLETIGRAFTGGASSPATPAEPPRGQVSQSLKKDPVCGTFVAEATAMQKTRGGETYYFCSAACRDKF